MSYRINGYTPSTLNYEAGASLRVYQPCARVTLDVTNALVAWQLWIEDDPGGWSPELQMIPGSKTIVRPGILACRVRAIATGPPWPYITFELIP